MKRITLFVATGILLALALGGCKEEPAVDKDAPNLKGKPAGPPPSVAVGGGGPGTPDSKAGPGANAKVQ